MAEPLVHVPSGGWTVDDLDALPESHHRYELTDGALTVSPSPAGPHQTLVARLLVRLEATAPDDVAITHSVDVRFARSLTRIPDLLAVRSDEPWRHWFRPDEVLLAVEVESPGSHVEDRVTKPALYARHGIPHYWRVELDPLRVTVSRLDGEAYAVVSAGDRIRTVDPFPVDVALADLLPRWARRGGPGGRPEA